MTTRFFFKHRRYILCFVSRYLPAANSAPSRGMTVLELLVASCLGLMILAMTIGATRANQVLYEVDLARTRLNQNMRSALTIVGSDIRQAGERLPIAFPAIEIIDGEDGGPDELILRRNLLDEVLFVCEDVLTTDVSDKIYLSSDDADASPACVYGGQTAAYAAWAAYRAAADNGTVRAYIFNLSTKDGEFFNYTGEGDNGAEMYIQRPAAGFSADFQANVSAIYILVEWHYRISSLASQQGVLQLIENQDTDHPQSVIFGLTNFQVNAIDTDDNVLTSFSAANNWTLLKALELTTTGEDRSGKQTVNSTLTARFFPRNILSN